LSKKHFNSIAVIVFSLLVLYAGGAFDAFGWFLRTGWLGLLTPASTTGRDYGYGLGDNGRGYGTGYGYISGEEFNNTNSRYASGIQENVGVTLSGWATTTTGTFTWYNNIHIEIPAGTIITPVLGWTWSGIIHIPTSGTYTVIDASTVQWVVNLDFSFFWGAQFSKPVKIVIPVSVITPVKIRADHRDGLWLTTGGLTRSSTAICTSGVANYQYDGGDVLVNGGTVTIYTCAASTFVAYTPAPTWWWGGWWWGGGGWWGWWWGGWTPTKDVCANGDKSWNEYDGKCNDNNKDGEKVKIIKSRWEVGSDLLSDSGYNAEYTEAYNFALSKGITTMPTIQKANMTWILTRSAMAKMVVNYAINVLGKAPDATLPCTFTDISTQTTEMQDYIIKSCQLWLMGQKRTEFTPKGTVTRAQLWTVISRMLYTTLDSGAPYYSVHLNVLKDKWVITVINPTGIEKRVYLMLMLMRAAKL